MSKSLKRVRAAILDAGLPDTIIETGKATTAQMAADKVGCDVNQIVKSIIFAGGESGDIFLFLTAGGNRVDGELAGTLVGEPLVKADAAAIRASTGFAIGGVSPLGHLTTPSTFLDCTLEDYDVVWAAAGTPHHVFSISPDTLSKVTNSTVSDFTEIM